MDNQETLKAIQEMERSLMRQMAVLQHLMLTVNEKVNELLGANEPYPDAEPDPFQTLNGQRNIVARAEPDLGK